MKYYKHYLITKFNVRREAITATQDDLIDVTTDDNYLKQRFSLFLKYTVPSVNAQTCNNFIWLILFSEHTPEKYKKIMSDIVSEHDNYYAVYVSDYEDSSETTSRILSKENVDWYITSRLDNDDALAKTYIEEIQNIVSEQNNIEKQVIIFKNGYQYDEKRKLLVKYYFPHNHFSTLISKGDSVETIYKYNHMNIHKSVNLNSYDNKKPMWMEVVHESNVSNRMHIKYNSIIKENDLYEKFGLKNIEIEERLYKHKIYTLLSKPMNLCRITRKYGVRKSVSLIVNKIFGRVKK